MDPGVSGDRVYLLGPLRLDCTRKILERDGAVLPVGPKVVDTLAVLVENAGTVVDKDTLVSRIWPDTAVADSSLTKNICVLRKLLDDGNEGTSAIQTIARRGYRYVGSVEQETAVPRSPIVRRLMPAAAGVLAFSLLIFVPAGRTRSAVPSLTEADRQYLVGRHIWNRMERSELLKALARFESAAALDPFSPLAHAGIADTYVAMSMVGVGPPRENLSKARTAAERAVALNPRAALPHASLGLVRLLADFDRPGAEREFRAAIAIDANSAAAHFGYGILLAHSGRLRQAREVLRRAQELDPVSVLVGIERGRTEYYDRRYAPAIQILNDVVDREPGASQAHYYLALSLRQLGKVDESLARLRQARLHPNVIAEDEEWIRSVRDGPGGIRRLLAERLRLVNTKEADPEVVLVPASDAADIDTAVAVLEQMWQSRRIELLQLRVSPRFDSLRSDSRFIALDRRVWRD